jgi:hypothetical protein
MYEVERSDVASLKAVYRNFAVETEMNHGYRHSG